MTITHQTVLGEDGRPSAAIIPWDVFQQIRDALDDGELSADEIEAMREAERDRLEGNEEAFESHSAVKSRLGIE